MSANERDSDSEQVVLTGALSPNLLQAMAATVGVVLPAERAAELAPQAEPHFALLRALDAIAHSSTEPAAEFHLDTSRSTVDG